MRHTLLAGAVLVGLVAPAKAETWVTVHGDLAIEVDSLYTVDGYTLFKTRALDAKGAVSYQHKEAINCAAATHAFRGMYSGTARLDNKNDADVTWRDWKTNPREAWNIDRLYAIKTFVCARVKR